MHLLDSRISINFISKALIYQIVIYEKEIDTFKDLVEEDLMLQKKQKLQ